MKFSTEAALKYEMELILMANDNFEYRLESKITGHFGTFRLTRFRCREEAECFLVE